MADVTQRPATAAEIRGIIGDVDDQVIASIVRTEASAANVMQAAHWFRGGGGLEDEAGHEPHGQVREVYQILLANEPPDDL